MSHLPESEFVVDTQDAGTRLDQLVARHAGLSVAQAKILFVDGRVRVDGRRARKGDAAQAGARIAFESPGDVSPTPDATVSLNIPWADKWLLGIDKPAGMSVHPLRAQERGTVANAVVAHYPDVLGASDESRAPGLLHRLDRDTSGLLLWARTPDAFTKVRRQFESQRVTKRYLALVEGHLDESGQMDAGIGHVRRNARRMAIDAPNITRDAQPALTRYAPLAQGTGVTLVSVDIVTGVRHQIRVHLAALGYPIVGDSLYGAAPVDGFPRHALHAASVGFEHPNGEGWVEWTVSPAEELVRLWEERGVRSF